MRTLRSALETTALQFDTRLKALSVQRNKIAVAIGRGSLRNCACALSIASLYFASVLSFQWTL